MRVTNPFQSSVLRRVTSRTNTASKPLTDARAEFIFGIPDFDELYAGPVDALRFPPSAAPMHSVSILYPVFQGAVQVFGVLPADDASQDPSVTLLVDLGFNRDISRIELYGNLALPPVDENGLPKCNFGLPRSVSVSVCENPILAADLHKQARLRLWLEDAGGPFKRCYLNRDVRALWGWTPLRLDPAYGRFVLLAFRDFPLVSFGKYDFRRGIDIQRLLIYPFLEDSCHEPDVECCAISSRQSAYSFPGGSAYWSHAGVGQLDPALHQSVFLDESTWRVNLPSSIAGIRAETQNAGSAPGYSSDLVKCDGTETVYLVIAATSDQIPLVEGVGLSFLDEPHQKYGAGDADLSQLSYEVSVDVTNDDEAAWSADAAHPGWRQVSRTYNFQPLAERLAIFRFSDPVWARYVRLRVRLFPAPQTGGDPQYGRFWFSYLQLIRPRDFFITPEPDQDLQVDLVLLRLRGNRLSDDYAFIDGQSGLSLTLEVRRGGDPFQVLRTVRTLLDLVENNQARMIVNQRYIDKPVQKYVEKSHAVQSGSQQSQTTTDTDNRVKLKPGAENVSVVRSGNYTKQVSNAASELASQDGPPRAEFTSRDSSGVESYRSFLLLPNTDFSGLLNASNVLDVIDDTYDLAQRLADTGYPANIGVAVSGDIGAALGLTAALGGSVSLGFQLGGGNTRTVQKGDQSTFAETQSRTVYSMSNQLSHSVASSDQTRNGTSDETRTVERTDNSAERRRSSPQVHYGGVQEDIILVTWPVQRRLTGDSVRGLQPGDPRRIGDALRLRVDHLPPGIRIDVEFRGTAFAKRGQE